MRAVSWRMNEQVAAELLSPGRELRPTERELRTHGSYEHAVASWVPRMG